VRAVDTNVIIRLFVLDDAAQAAAARQAASSDLIFVPKTVIVETEWVLRRSYGQSRATIIAVFEALLAAANFQVEDEAAVEKAIGWFARGMDLADALHLASSDQAKSFLTFDVSMRRRASMLDTKPRVVAP